MSRKEPFFERDSYFFRSFIEGLPSGLARTRQGLALDFLLSQVIAYLLVYLVTPTAYITSFYLVGGLVGLAALLAIRFDVERCRRYILAYILINSAYIGYEVVSQGLTAFTAYNLWLMVYLLLAFTTVGIRAGMWVGALFTSIMLTLGVSAVLGVSLFGTHVDPGVQLAASMGRILGFMSLSLLIARVVLKNQSATKALKELNQGLQETNQLLVVSEEELRMQMEEMSALSQQLYDSEQRFALAVEGSDVGVWDLDVTRGALYTSERCRSIIGIFSDRQIELEEWMTNLYPDDVPGVQQRVQAVMEGKTDIFESTQRFIRPDGTVVWTFNRAKCAYDEAGQPLRLVGTMTDMTKTKEVEARLEELNLTLTRANQELQTAEEELRQNLDAQQELTNQLAASEQRFMLAAEGSEAGIWDLNMETDQMFISPVGRQLLNMSKDDVPSLNSITNCIVAEDRPLFMQALKRVINRQQTRYEVLLRLQHDGGKTLWVTSRGMCAFSEFGDPVRVVGTFSDITPLKKAEENLAEANQELMASQEELRQNLEALSELTQRLEESEERFSLAIEGSQVGIWDIRFGAEPSLFLSERAQTILGLPYRNEYSINRALQVFDPGFAAQLTQDIDQLQSGARDVFYKDYHLTGPDHKAVWVTVRGRCHYDENGKAVRMSGTIADITESVEAKLALERSQVQLLEAQRIGKIASFTLSLEDGLLHASPLLAEMLELPEGYPSENIKWVDHIHADDYPVAQQAWQDCITQGIPLDVEYRCYTRHGHLKYFQSRGTLVSDLVTGRDQLLGTIQDVTAEVNLRHQQELARQQAEEVAKAKAEFLATMSHEIRTPLNAVIGLTEILLMDSPKPEQLTNLQTLSYSGNLLLALINDILDYSKIDAGKVEFEQIPFNLNDTLVQLVRMLTSKAEEKQIALNFSKPFWLRNLVVGDLTRLSQVLTNLIGNAIKFTHEGSVSVTYSLVKETEDAVRLRFEVKDTGIGIAPDQAANIFDSFTQASSSTNRQYGGTGLGLAISKKLVELQGGGIGVTSAIGKGSTFWFELSFTKGKLIETKPVGQAQEGGVIPDLKGVQVLLVDDNEINILVTRKFLERWGVTVHAAANGQEAVNKALAEPYDMILMDLRMPVMTGFEATDILRNHEREDVRQLPIIALTASIPANLSDDILSKGFTGYLTKPYHPNDLYKAVSHALESAHV